MAKLKKPLSSVKKEPPLLLLRSGDSNAKLSANLKRVREIASDMPVLVLPDMQHSLNLPGAVSGESAKTNKNLRLNLKKLARILRCGLPQNQMESELSHLAISDELTGLYNRRGFLVLGSEAMKLAHRVKKNVLLFFAHLDNLKQTNHQLCPKET